MFRIEPRGLRRLDNVNILNLRISRPTPVLEKRLSVEPILDLFNVFNSNAVTGRVAAVRAASYSPNNADAYMSVGFLSYRAGDRAAALEAFLKAKSLNPKFKDAFDAALRFRPEYKAIQEDQEFVKKLFPER